VDMGNGRVSKFDCMCCSCFLAGFKFIDYLFTFFFVNEYFVCTRITLKARMCNPLLLLGVVLSHWCERVQQAFRMVRFANFLLKEKLSVLSALCRGLSE